MSSITARSGQQYFSFDPRSVTGSCLIWLDASDANTLFSNSAGTTPASVGGVVAHWKDKSGLGYNYTQSTAGSEPTYTSTGVITFGTSRFLSNTTNGFGSNVTVLFVGRPDASTANQRTVFSNAFIVRQSFTTVGIINSSSTFVSYGTTLDGSASIIGGAVLGFSGSSAITTGFVNGSQFNTVTIGTAGNSRFNNLGNSWGILNEVLVFSNISADARIQVEGYLAWKWGLVANLPTTHAYKTFPPTTVRQFIPPDISGCTLWLDGLDQGSMALSGTNVTMWNDKSGRNHHAYQTIAGRYPTVSSSGVVFNGTSQYLGIRNPSVAALSIFIVLQATSSTQAGDVIRKGTGIGPTSNFEFAVLYTTGTTASHIYGLFRNANASSANAYYLNGGTTSRYLLTVTWTIGSFIDLFTNATSRTSVTLAGPQFFIERDMRIGANFDANDIGDGGTIANYWSGTISEIILYNKTVTLAERYAIEGYLAKKWNLASSLPSTHPGNELKYLNSTPLFTPPLTSGLLIWTDASTLTQADGTALTTWPNGGSGGTVNCTGTVQRNQLNNLPIVRFTTSQTWSPASAVNLSAYTLCFVTRQTGGSNKRVLQGITANQLYGYWMGYKGTYFIDSANTQAGLYTAPSDTAWDIFTHTRTASGAYLFRWNGVEIFRGTTSSASNMLGLAINTSSTSPSETSDCEVAEIILYNSVLTIQQLVEIEGYLAGKWGLQNKFSLYTQPTIVAPFVCPIPVNSIRIWCDAATLTQAGGTVLTTWTNSGTSGPTVNCTGTVFTDRLNGYRVVNFGTASTWSTNPVISYSSYTLIFVARLTNVTNRRIFQTNTLNQLFGYWGGYKRALYTNDGAYTTQLTTVPADGSWDIISHKRTAGGAFTFRWNGRTLFYGPVSTADPLSGLCINTGANAAESSTCQIAEIIVCDSLISDATIQGTEEYLSAKWGIPISNVHAYGETRA